VSWGSHPLQVPLAGDEGWELEKLGILGYVGEEGYSILTRRWLRWASNQFGA
jgi:hypothetical protein